MTSRDDSCAHTTVTEVSQHMRVYAHFERCNSCACIVATAPSSPGSSLRAFRAAESHLHEPGVVTQQSSSNPAGRSGAKRHARCLPHFHKRVGGRATQWHTCLTSPRDCASACRDEVRDTSVTAAVGTSVPMASEESDHGALKDEVCPKDAVFIIVFTLAPIRPSSLRYDALGLRWPFAVMSE